LNRFQIDEQNRERAAGFPRTADALAKAMEEEATVRQTGEHVVIGEVEQAQLVLLVAVYVGDGSGETQGFPTSVPDAWARPRNQRKLPFLHGNRNSSSIGTCFLEKAAHRLSHALGVLGMKGELEPAQRLIRGVPQQLAETGK